MYTGFSTGHVDGVELRREAADRQLTPARTARWAAPSSTATACRAPAAPTSSCGGYHVGLAEQDDTLCYFVQAKYQFAVATQGDYRPGNEFDAAAG